MVSSCPYPHLSRIRYDFDDLARPPLTIRIMEFNFESNTLPEGSD